MIAHSDALERSKLIALFVVLIVGVGYAIGYGAVRPESGSRYVAAILSLSIILEIIISVTNRFADADVVAARWTVTIEILKLLLWTAYWWLCRTDFPSGTVKIAFEAAAWFSFFVGMAVVIRITRYTSSAHEKNTKTQWPQGILQSLCCMLLAFLHTTYFMTLALAIDDKANGGRTLYRTSSFVTPDEISPRVETRDRVDSDPLSTCSKPHRDRVRRFFFEIGKSDLRQLVELEKRAPHATLFERICGEEQDGREAYVRSLLGHPPLKFGQAETDPIVIANAWNLREMQELRMLFRELKSETRKRFRVEILGHANKQKPADLGNMSNTDRSATRMQHIQRMMYDLADEAGLKLLFDPHFAGADDDFLAPLPWEDIRALDPGLSAEVRLRPIPIEADEIRVPQRPLTLLDYTYFMIYTITTTGYGDLVPSSPFGRFLVSIANLAELFFIVIIVNAIVAARKDADDPKDAEHAEKH